MSGPTYHIALNKQLFQNPSTLSTLDHVPTPSSVDSIVWRSINCSSRHIITEVPTCRFGSGIAGRQAARSCGRSSVSRRRRTCQTGDCAHSLPSCHDHRYHDATGVHMSNITTYHDSFCGGSHEKTRDESRWRRYRHKPQRRINHFMAHVHTTVVYLPETT